MGVTRRIRTRGRNNVDGDKLVMYLEVVEVTVEDCCSAGKPDQSQRQAVASLALPAICSPPLFSPVLQPPGAYEGKLVLLKSRYDR
jgi:uncharacterized protein (UPF0262 family)